MVYASICKRCVFGILCYKYIENYICDVIRNSLLSTSKTAADLQTHVA
jgi:hypothetical protein